MHTTRFSEGYIYNYYLALAFTQKTLISAVDFQSYHLTQLHIFQGADVNGEIDLREFCYSPLFVALMCQDTVSESIIKLLIDSGADTTQGDFGGFNFAAIK